MNICTGIKIQNDTKKAENWLYTRLCIQCRTKYARCARSYHYHHPKFSWFLLTEWQHRKNAKLILYTHTDTHNVSTWNGRFNLELANQLKLLNKLNDMVFHLKNIQGDFMYSLLYWGDGILTAYFMALPVYQFMTSYMSWIHSITKRVTFFFLKYYPTTLWIDVIYFLISLLFTKPKDHHEILAQNSRNHIDLCEIKSSTQ